MTTELIWISDWEIQCCGSEFAVGDEVAWPILGVRHPDRYLEPLVGAEISRLVTGSYAGHEEEPPPQQSGTVRRIRTVSCRYAPLPPPMDLHHPVPGTSQIGDIAAIEKWFGTDFDPDVLTFCGWLVDLDVP